MTTSIYSKSIIVLICNEWGEFIKMISQENILELATRRNIYNYISKNPGIHFRELERKMNFSDGTLKYHLNFLQKRNLITVESTGRYNNYFVKEKVGREDKKILSLLQREIYYNIILGLFINIMCTRGKLIDELDLDIHINTMTYHLKKLQSMEIIEIVKVKKGIVKNVEKPSIIEYSVTSNEKLYRLKDPKKIYDLVIRYQDELKKDSLMHFLLEIMEQRNKYGYQKKGDYPSRPEKVERMLGKIYEVFPHPYHI